jgi:glycolate oxidase
MSIQYNPVDIAQQMRVKTIFDPDWLLNPGKVFPLQAQEAYLTSVRE